MNRPRIAIVGSCRPELLRSDSTPEEVQQAAFAIGAALAAAGCPILVYSSDPRFLESYVVAGYRSSKALPPGKPILCLANQHHPIEFEGMDDPDGPFDSHIDPHANWEIGFYQSIRDRADGVLLIGGGPTTLAAGLVAIHAEKALYSVAAFGGAADTVWLYLNVNPHLESSAERQHMKHWSAQVSAERCAEALVRQAAEAEEAAGEERRLAARLAELERLEKRSLPTFGAIVLFAAVLVLSLAELPSAGSLPFWAALFGVLMSGGVMGASLRLLWKPLSTHPGKTTAVLGVAAGLLVGLSYLIPQLIGSQLESSVGLFLVPALVAVSAGFGFDYAFEQWRRTSKRKIHQGLGGDDR